MGEGGGTSVEKKSLLGVLNSWNASAYYWTFVAGAGVVQLVVLFNKEI